MYRPKIGYTTVSWAVHEASDRLETAIRDIAAVGFSAFETFAHTAEAIDGDEHHFKAMLDHYDLRLVCLDKTRSYYQDPGQRAEIVADHIRSAQFLFAHGGEILMTVPRGVPDGSPRWSSEDFKVAAETLNEVGKAALDVGVRMALHPHWGTYIESADEIDQIMELTDPRYVFFAPDSGQIAKGDADPVAVARKYIARIAHVHLKDVSPSWDELRRMGTALASPLGYAPLGEGTVDLPGFLNVLAEANYSGWIMGELDRYEDPKAGAEIGKRFLTEVMQYSL